MLQGKRIVAFVVGGVTRSEMRVAHKLSAKLGRDILIGSTSCDTPTTFLKSLQVAPFLFVCILNIHLCFLLECMPGDADFQHHFVHLKQGSVLCARGLCSVHVMQIFNAALCTINRGLCFMLEYNAKVQVVDSGAVEYRAAICAFALSFLIQGLCIPELFWLLTAPVINMYIVPKASAA